MADETFIPHDIVYLGKRLITEGKVGVAFQIINEDGTLGKTWIIDMKRGRDKTVGGVYTGTSFTDTKVRGYDDTRYVKQWPDQGDRITWRAKDEAVELELKSKNLEKNADKVSDIERIMLPLRKLYEGHRKAGRWSDKEALEAAVLRALRAAPRASEAS